MSKDIEGTGGAGGIGLAIADAFLQHRAQHIVIVDLKGAEASKTLNGKHGHKTTFIECDVTKDMEKVTKEILDTHETVDVLINSAGIINEGNPRKVIVLNVTAVIEWSLKYFEIMRIDQGVKGGTIINVSSIYGFVIDPFLPTYKASKYAVMGCTKTKRHYKKTGVKFVICPGITTTELIADYKNWEVEENREEFVALFNSCS